MNWISIKDQLPDFEEGVLVTDGQTVTAAERYRINDKAYGWSGHGFNGYEWDFEFDDEDVTHWMPLPDPPR